MMQKLMFMLDNSQGETRAVVVAAIGSAAHASDNEFASYFPEVMKRLVLLMSLHSNEDELMLRAVATDTLVAVAEAVGKDAFRPYLGDLMNKAMEGLSLENTRLRECSYYFFAGAAQVFGDEFAPYLIAIVPHLIHSCQLDENNTHVENETEELDDVDADENEEELSFVFKSAIADEKEVAADTIGEIFQHTGAAFLPYAETCVKELVKLSSHMTEGVRKTSFSSLFTFLRTFYRLSNAQDWIPGLPPAVPLHENVAQLNALVMPAILSGWEEEDDKMVVVQLCQDLTEVTKLCGPALISDHITTIAEHLKLIFEKKAFCQLELADDEGPLDEDEQAEFDALLISAASDVVGALAAVLGESFVPFAKVFIPYLTKYYKKTKSTSERSMAIGSLGEIATEMKAAITEYTEQLFPLFVKALSDEDDEVRSNAAFAIGALCQNTTIDVSSQYPALLMALHPLFHGQALPNITDNACGAVARMTMAHPNSVPLDSVLPVLMQALPIKQQLEENETVFKLLFSLIRSQNPWIMNNLPQVLRVFGEVLPKEDDLLPKTRQEMVEILMGLNQQFPTLNIADSPLATYL
ncbi:hypothetical protein BGW38_008731 [Lunasporangiospora selenospora]|uniref:Importin subunit beta-1/Transportin-1-like TPR repeats domain-containing protein n=1 Tax=Lunasporangiospora selenospora TaxID=979761 RepID=A0A9P6KII9_9FUNG|nr:hypothetical protein BGW38_008731 [Lunasporangiospora selenospora]